MTTEATFEIERWDEKPFDEEGAVTKLTTASVTKKYSGDVTGTSVTEWVMAYKPDDTAEFVGIERIRGSIGDQSGTIVIRHVGTFADGAATADLVVLSGTEGFERAAGTGSMVADPAGKVSLTLTGM